MKLHTQLLLVASVAAALLLLSHCVVADVLTGAKTMPMHALRDVEDEVSFVEEAAYPRRRVLYGNQYAGYNGLGANKAACYGSCPGRGQPYTGRGCQAIFGCRR